MTRVLFYTTRLVTNAIYAHTLNDPADRYESMSCNQCIIYMPNEGGSGIGAGVDEFTINNTVIY